MRMYNKQTKKKEMSEQKTNKLLDADSPQEAVAREAGGRGAERRRPLRRREHPAAGLSARSVCTLLTN